LAAVCRLPVVGRIFRGAEIVHEVRAGLSLATTGTLMPPSAAPGDRRREPGNLATVLILSRYSITVIGGRQVDIRSPRMGFSRAWREA